MKIDPINKVLYLDTGDNLGQVIYVLKEIYPNGEWERYKINAGNLYDNRITYTYPNWTTQVTPCDAGTYTRFPATTIGTTTSYYAQSINDCPEGTTCIDGQCISNQPVNKTATFILDTT